MKKVIDSESNLNSIIGQIIKIDLSNRIDDIIFNEKLAELQSLIGQNDGLLAGIYFDDPAVNQWCNGALEDRRAIIKKYIEMEMQVLENESKYGSS